MRNPASLSSRFWRDLGAWDAERSARVASAIGTGANAERGLTVIAHSGDGLLWAAAGAIGLAFGSKPTRRLIVRTSLGVLLAAGGVGLIKQAVRRERPRSPRPERYPLWTSQDVYSFPSGHSARLSATATVLGASHPTAGAALGLWSAVVGLSRVALSAHYVLDVAAGLAIGVCAGRVARWLSRSMILPEC